MYQHPDGGWIEVICGSMFSGKTEELLRRIKRAEIARQNIQVFKHSLDVRFQVTHVASHNGIHHEASVIQSASQILEQLQPETTIVAIDEAQFFDWSIADVSNQMANNGLRVIVAGLDMDFRGEPFGPMPLLMAIAERVDKFQAICVKCGRPASRTQRLVDGRPASHDEPVILVGASEVYEARCRHCHEVPHRQDAARK